MVKLRLGIPVLVLVAALAFFAGSWLVSRGDKPAGERKVLYYVDPMNPAFRSDKPGVAPCGMPLEPVYADQGDSGAGLPGAMPRGTVRITPEKQQMIGVRTIKVEKAPWNHTLRVLGRVTPDEAQVYRVNAAAGGWIRDVKTATTGSLVRKDELLATFSFFSTEFRGALQAYINSASAAAHSYRHDAEPKDAAGSIQKSRRQRSSEFENIRLTGRGTQASQADYYKQNLFSYGVAESQLEEIVLTGKVPEAFDIRSPVEGFVLYRNVNPGLRFDRGAEFYRIADLSKVWIMADIFENEASWLKPGTRVKVDLPYRNVSLPAHVSTVLPLFDPATRTLRVRLLADNPGYVMRPDMFVNVELRLSGPPAMVVPADAVLDSGLKKTVFVDRGNGYFEPRSVETGHALGDRIEVVQGLMPGEKIVVAGNFLIDSESRFQHPAAPAAEKTGIDPVCRMSVDMEKARAAGLSREYKGKTYVFCAPGCAAAFEKNPGQYLGTPQPPGKTSSQSPPMAKSPARSSSAERVKQTATSGEKTGIDPVCRMSVDAEKARAAGLSREYKGETYVFCAPACAAAFKMNPERFLHDDGAAPARVKRPAPEAMDIMNAPARSMPGSMPLPGATKPQASGAQLPGPMFGPPGPAGSGLPGTAGPGAHPAGQGPGGMPAPVPAGPGKQGGPVSPDNPAPAPD